MPGGAQDDRLGLALPPAAFNERHGLLLWAPPSMLGGDRGLWAPGSVRTSRRAAVSRHVLAQAHNAFTEEGRIANEQLQEGFAMNIANFNGPGRSGEALPVREAGVCRVPT